MRARSLGILVLVAHVTAGCNDPAGLCAALAPGDRVPAVQQLTDQAGAFELSTVVDGPEAFHCCSACARSIPPTCDCGVDCADPAWQTTPIRLGEEYAGECNPSSSVESAQSCVVFAQGDTIRAIASYCLD